MAIIICPECNNKISEYADLCPNCGFQLQKYLKENHFTNIKGVLVCPKCANIYNGLDEKFGMPQRLKCEYCGTFVIQTNENNEGMFKLCNDQENFDKKCIELAKQYGNNQFDKTAFDNRYVSMRKSVQDFLDKDKKQTQQSNIPKCPTCNSTNIHKISVTSKAINAGMFGLFGNKRKKQFHCDNCGYEW